MKKAIKKGSKKISKKGRSKSVPKQITEINYSTVKSFRIEWFDDRFYKIILPANLHPSLIEHIPTRKLDIANDYTGVYMESVTTIIGNSEPRPLIERWRGDVGNITANYISEKAKEKGSNIHNAIDLMTKGYLIIYQNRKIMNYTDKQIKEFARKKRRKYHVINSQDEMIQIVRYYNMLNQIKPVVEQSEHTTFNLSELYAGTIDQIWKFDSDTLIKIGRSNPIQVPAGRYIVDLKTGKYHFDVQHWTQLSAYAFSEIQFGNIDGAFIVRTDSDTKTGIEGLKLHFKPITELQEYYEHFKDLKKVYNFSNPVYPKTYEFPTILNYERIE
jgi:hypothetical protein